MCKLKKLTITTLMMFMLLTPIFSIPKLPTIPNISASVTLPDGVQESVKKSAAEAVKNLNIDWSKFVITLK